MSNNYSQLAQFSWVKSVTVTPSNTTVIAASGLFIEGGGTVVVEYEDGSTDSFTVPNFFEFHGSVTKLLPGTTATGVHALY